MMQHDVNDTNKVSGIRIFCGLIHVKSKGTF